MQIKPYEISQAMNELDGFLKVIASDEIISDEEVYRLRAWLDSHSHLCSYAPFSDLKQMIEDVLEDGVIDELERQEMLVMIQDQFLPGKFQFDAKNALITLHGILKGLAADHVVNEAELKFLQDWLECHSFLQGYWPFDEVYQTVEVVLEDGKVSPEEERELLDVCNMFMQKKVSPKYEAEEYELDFSDWLSSEGKHLQSLEGLCILNPVISFQNKRFCFAGIVEEDNRHNLEHTVLNLEGQPQKVVTPDLDYLVIGAKSDPNWAYSNYSRQIEKVVQFRKEGSKTLIVHEVDFHNALRGSA